MNRQQKAEQDAASDHRLSSLEKHTHPSGENILQQPYMPVTDKNCCHHHERVAINALNNQQENISMNKKHDHHDDHDHDHGNGNTPSWLSHWDLLTALAILVTLLTLRYGFNKDLPPVVALIVNLIAYLLAGRQVLHLAARKISRGDVFNEFVLMSVATIGAFFIGEFEEGVAVMVFYQIGEWFQDSAVSGAKKSIRALLDVRASQVTVVRNGVTSVEDPSTVLLSETIRVKPGEKVALDGELLSDMAVFNTSALTGESKPDTKYKTDKVYAGMVNTNAVADIRVTTKFKDSRLSQILSMVQDAAARKSQTQLFISRFAKWYTPFVFLMALLVCFVPALVVDDYQFREWFYRALVFLVISCPCALVVSIPLGYFGGIGLASRNGLLFKGGNYLDVMARVNTVVMDKTGTLTKGIFKVREIVTVGFNQEEMLKLAASLESYSTHPVAKAIVEHAGTVSFAEATEVLEVAGQGLKGKILGRNIIAGNAAMLKTEGVDFPSEVNSIPETTVLIAVDGVFSGYIIIADELKEDAAMAVSQLHAENIKTVILSGDKQSIVDTVANTLGVREAYGNLLPDEKVKRLQSLRGKGKTIAFVGDGVNDAPVIALADAGIAMGGLGSDASIETADIVIQNDQPSKIVSAIRIGKITRTVVWQNIILAFVVKIAVLALGASGVASLWEAVIADVGVALVAILNAARIQYIRV